MFELLLLIHINRNLNSGRDFVGLKRMTPSGTTRFFSIALTVSLLISCVNYTGRVFIAPNIPDSEFAAVYIYSSHTGCVDLGQMNVDIFVDGNNILELAENSFALIYLEAGEHVFNTSTDDQKACHGQWSPGKYWPTVNLQLQPSRSYYLQYNKPSGSCISTCDRHLTEVPAEIAIQEMQGTKEIKLRP
ncbi:DUF2846 domain-containing protein [Neptuniibacter sp. QD37_6]|uniref:DUF2846 domain-containing protein n=1 Tax=Neptuniibacter sp. QD37_6 TaxID=3398210 RepID=UPI0039F5A90D